MPYHVVVDETTRTIVIKGTGRGTTADTLQLITEHQQTFRDHIGFNVLYDSSDLQIDSSPADMLKVAQALFQDPEIRFGKFAVVVPESRAELARMFTALAHPHGVQANVFTHGADALSWLAL